MMDPELRITSPLELSLNLKAGHPRVVDFALFVRILEELDIWKDAEPPGDLCAVVELSHVHGVLFRDVSCVFERGACL